MNIEQRDIVIFGAGPASLSSAINLVDHGQKVTVIRPEVSVLPRSVYTSTTEYPPITNIVSAEFRHRLPYLRVLTEQGMDYRLFAGDDTFFMVDNAGFVLAQEEKLRGTENITIECLPQRIINRIEVADLREGVRVRIDGDEKRFDIAIDATGVNAHIARKIERFRAEEKFLAEYIYGRTFRGHLDLEEMILVFGPLVTTNWVCPNACQDGLIDVVVSAWGPRSDYNAKFLPTARSRLERLMEMLKQFPGIHFNDFQPLKVSLQENTINNGEIYGEKVYF